ncbi:hypothetical protein XANCAGTX0491_000840 [Xanthoria calcicola]
MNEMLEKTRKAKEAVKESLTRGAKRVSEFLKRNSKTGKEAVEAVKESMSRTAERGRGFVKRSSKNAKEAVRVFGKACEASTRVSETK